MKTNKKLVHIAIVILLLVVALPSSNALAFESGPNDAGAGVNLTGIGSEAWTNPGNIAGLGFATVSLYHGFQYSNYLQGTHYGFDIPLDATLTGIEVSINRQAFGPGPGIYDNVVSLVISDTLTGDNKANALSWPYTWGLATYGGPTDLWGTTLTPAEVNLDSFGVVLAAMRGNNGKTPKPADVDYMQITVYYYFSTTTAVDCEEVTVYGDTVTCTATVTRLGSDLTPTGSVSWATDGSGTFDPLTCTMTGSGGVASCSTLYTPTSVGTGTHLIIGSYSGDDYFVASAAEDTVTVGLRPVTVTADPKTKLYLAPDPELTYDVTAGTLVFSDTFTGTLSREPGEAVGTYAILQNTLALNENYDLTYVGADFTIVGLPITVTADPATKVYGQVDPTLTYTITSGTLLAGDTFTGTLTRVPGEDAGTYAILQGSLALPDYYALTFVSADLTITKADPTCVVTPYAVEYDKLAHTATGSCKGVMDETLVGLDLGATTHVFPGDYTDPWAFTDVTGNYNDLSGTVNDLISGYLYWFPVITK